MIYAYYFAKNITAIYSKRFDISRDSFESLYFMPFAKNSKRISVCISRSNGKHKQLGYSSKKRYRKIALIFIVNNLIFLSFSILGLDFQYFLLYLRYFIYFINYLNIIYGRILSGFCGVGNKN